MDTNLKNYTNQCCERIVKITHCLRVHFFSRLISYNIIVLLKSNYNASKKKKLYIYRFKIIKCNRVGWFVFVYLEIIKNTYCKIQIPGTFVYFLPITLYNIQMESRIIYTNY